MSSKRKDRQLAHKVQRVRITRTTAALDSAHGVVGLKPHALFWVRTWCAQHRKAWRQCLHSTKVTIAQRQDGVDANGMPVMVDDVTPVGEMDVHGHHRLLIVRCIGTPDQLESLVMWSCVEKWEYVTTFRVGVVAQGSGPEKVRPHTPRPKIGVLMRERTYDANDVMPLGWVNETYPVQRRVSPTEEQSMAEATLATEHTNIPKTTG